MGEEHYIVYTTSKRKRNRAIYQDCFALKTFSEVAPIDGHCDSYNVLCPGAIYRATLSNNGNFIAILFKNPSEKEWRHLEFLGLIDFVHSYKVI